MNFYTSMMETKDPNDPSKLMFKVLKISLACPACTEAGRASECTHMEKFRPPWKSASKYQMVKQIYSTNKNMFERESMGLNVEDADAVFPAFDVKEFLKRSCRVHPESRVLFVGLDPSGGGDSSMSIVTVSLYANTLVLVCVDEQPIKNVASMEAMLLNHVKRLRLEFPGHWLACFFESNLGQESSHAEAMLERERIDRCFVMHEKERTGVLTTNARKELYADTLKFYLAQKCIGFREQGLLSGNPSRGEPERIKQVLLEQLLNYRRVTVEAQPGRIAKHMYSGKIAGSRQDDLCLTLQLVTYWAVRFASQSIPGVDYSVFV